MLTCHHCCFQLLRPLCQTYRWKNSTLMRLKVVTKPFCCGWWFHLPNFLFLKPKVLIILYQDANLWLTRHNDIKFGHSSNKAEKKRSAKILYSFFANVKSIIVIKAFRGYTQVMLCSSFGTNVGTDQAIIAKTSILQVIWLVIFRSLGSIIWYEAELR